MFIYSSIFFSDCIIDLTKKKKKLTHLTNDLDEQYTFLVTITRCFSVKFIII